VQAFGAQAGAADELGLAAGAGYDIEAVGDKTGSPVSRAAVLGQSHLQKKHGAASMRRRLSGPP